MLHNPVVGLIIESCDWFRIRILDWGEGSFCSVHIAQFVARSEAVVHLLMKEDNLQRKKLNVFEGMLGQKKIENE